jgi:omega-6 fatty acid desaturase (delta-12 desaturase)
MSAFGAESFDAAVACEDAPSSSDRRSLARGLLLLAGYGFLYAATMVDAVAPFPLALNIAFAVGNGVCIAMLFIVGHDCCHGALVPGRRWNLWLGRFAFIPVIHSVSLWRLAHNQHHHGRTNLKGVDPVWAPMSPQEYAHATPARRWLERAYRSAFGPVIYYYGQIWLSLMVLPISALARAQWKRHVPDTIFVLCGLLATIGGVYFIGRLVAPQRPFSLVLLLGWAIPYASWNYLAALTVYLNHTHPDLPWFGGEKSWSFYNGNVLGTVHVKMPIDIFPLYTDVMAHAAHHTNVRTPVYALPDEQSVLKARFGADVKEYVLSLSEYRRILSACKLFDFQRMCWTDLNGVETGTKFLVSANQTD